MTGCMVCKPLSQVLQKRRPAGADHQPVLAIDAVRRTRPDVELVGVAAAHRHPAPAAFRPAIPVRHLPLGRRVLYETWHAARWPKVRTTVKPL